ncbi:MAG: energy transducer TonB [Planctomycetes bacterium]|nr:energy transducer TonB [Planctomycetota bacterium]
MPPTEHDHRTPRSAWVVACSLSCVLHASVLVVCGSLPFADAGGAGSASGSDESVFELRLSVRPDDPSSTVLEPRVAELAALTEPLEALPPAPTQPVEASPVQTSPPVIELAEALVVAPELDALTQPDAGSPANELAAEAVVTQAVFQPVTESSPEAALAPRPMESVAMAPSDRAATDKAGATVIAAATSAVTPSVGATRAAVVIENPRPDYPCDSELRGEHGEVVCLLHIAADGKVSSVEIVSSCGFKRLDRAAVDGLKRWRFQPALEHGVAVASRLRHKVKFVFE